MGPIERKGSEDLAKSSATVVDQSNLGQAPRSREGRENAFPKVKTVGGIPTGANICYCACLGERS